MQGVAAGSAVAVAGCSGNGQNAGTGSGGGSQTTDAEFTSYLTTVPQDIQYNPFNMRNVEREAMLSTMGWPAVLNKDAGEWVPMIFEDWSVDGNKFTIQVSDKFTWHDGTDVTAQDIVTTIRLRDLSGVYGQEIEDISSSDGTVELTLGSKQNPAITEYNILQYTEMILPHANFKQFISQLDEASNQEERDSVLSEVANYTIDEPLGAGPFQFEEANSRELVLTRYDDYPIEYIQQSHSDVTGNDITSWPSKNSVKTLKFLYQGDDNQVMQAVQAGEVDGGASMSGLGGEDVSLPNKYEVLTSPVYWGIGLHYDLFDSGPQEFQDRRVRQALYHVIDAQAVGEQKNIREAELATSHPFTGMPGEVAEEWLSSDLRDSLQTYDGGAQRATELLEEAGYQKRNGKWFKPNGDRFSVKYACPANVTHYTPMGQVLTSNLKEFGIDAQLEAVEGTTFSSKSYEERDYGMSTPGFWGGAAPHPWFGFQFVYDYSPQDYLAAIGPTLEAPPIGEPDSDERIEIDVYKKMERLSKDIPEKEQKQITNELAWVTNWNAIKIPTNRQIERGVISRNKWKYPPSDSAALKVNRTTCGVYWAFHAGLCQAK